MITDEKAQKQLTSPNIYLSRDEAESYGMRNSKFQISFG